MKRTIPLSILIVLAALVPTGCHRGQHARPQAEVDTEALAVDSHGVANEATKPVQDTTETPIGEAGAPIQSKEDTSASNANELLQKKATGTSWRVSYKPTFNLGPPKTVSFMITLLEGGVIEVHHGTLRGSWAVRDGTVTVSLIAKWPLSGKDVTWYTGKINTEFTQISGRAHSEVGGDHSWFWTASRVRAGGQ